MKKEGKNGAKDVGQRKKAIQKERGKDGGT